MGFTIIPTKYHPRVRKYYLNEERHAETDATAREDTLKSIVPKNTVDDRM